VGTTFGRSRSTFGEPTNLQTRFSVFEQQLLEIVAPTTVSIHPDDWKDGITARGRYLADAVIGAGGRGAIRRERRLGVSLAAAATRDWINHPRKQTKFRGRALSSDEERRLVFLISIQPDATLAELQQALPTRAALSTLWRTIDRLDLTGKKTVLADEQRRPDVAADRRRWQDTQPLHDARASGSCPATVPISIRSNRHSPS
jgi:hypothetical protein